MIFPVALIGLLFLLFLPAFGRLDRVEKIILAVGAGSAIVLAGAYALGLLGGGP